MLNVFFTIESKNKINDNIRVRLSASVDVLQTVENDSLAILRRDVALTVAEFTTQMVEVYEDTTDAQEYTAFLQSGVLPNGRHPEIEFFGDVASLSGDVGYALDILITKMELGHGVDRFRDRINAGKAMLDALGL